MTVVLLVIALSAAALVIGRCVFADGIRNGDRPGDASVGPAERDDAGLGVSFWVRNPGAQPVLIGASLRRRGLRLRGEPGQLVSSPRRTLRPRLLAGQQTVLCAIPPGATETVVVPFSRSIRRRGELVVAIGEPDRLRVIRQAVELRPSRPGCESMVPTDQRGLGSLLSTRLGPVRRHRY